MDRALSSRDDAFSKAKASATRLLKIRLRSKKEIADKLALKGIRPAVIRKTVRFFTEAGLLDDRQFARAWIISRLKKPMGWRRIRRELELKGVNAELIDDECARARNAHDEDEALKKLALRRMRQYREVNKLKAKRRLCDYLIRRGFASAAVYTVIREIST